MTDLVKPWGLSQTVPDDVAEYIEALERENAYLEQRLKNMRDLLTKREEEHAELRKDAERYQWLTSYPYHDGYVWRTQDICIPESYDSSVKPAKEQVDAAIDEAMK
jgi:hypothetical protein